MELREVADALRKRLTQYAGAPLTDELKKALAEDLVKNLNISLAPIKVEFKEFTENDTAIFLITIPQAPKMLFIDSAEQAGDDALFTRFDYHEDQFRRFFTTPYEQFKAFIGKPFTVVNRLKNSEDAAGGEGEAMYRIRFDADGAEINAYGHEVCVLDYGKCH